jgi:hypothetical protein
MDLAGGTGNIGSLGLIVTDALHNRVSSEVPI